MKATRRVVTLSLLLASPAAFGLDTRPSVLVYPSSATVPENLLRIELRFSVPLHHPLTIDGVKLFDANGREIEHPFLDLPLPASDGKRVTILLHPARVKSGLGANLVSGRALHAGTKVTLVVEHPELGQPARKAWEVTGFDDAPPRPEQWTFNPPRQGSRSPLVLRLDSPISSSAETLIAIRDPDGRRVAGTTHLETGETVWRFIPAQPWHAGSFAVVIHPDLEDPAGNRPCARFEGIDASRVRCEKEAVWPFRPWATPFQRALDSRARHGRSGSKEIRCPDPVGEGPQEFQSGLRSGGFEHGLPPRIRDSASNRSSFGRDWD